VRKPAPPSRRSLVGALALTLSMAAIPAGAATAAPPSEPLTISPAPGTPDASPQTQVSILGIAPRLIDSVRLIGAASGSHNGSLRRYFGGRGASFVPARTFTQGERVAAVIRVHGRAPVRFSFTIARLQPAQPLLNIRKLQVSKLQHFVSQPSLLAPRITVLKHSAGSVGDIFLTPLPSPVVHPGGNNVVTISPVGPGGPMIIDGRGNLIWFRQLTPPTVAANLQVQSYRGRRVLTWWQGGVTPSAFGIGEGVIADSSYHTLATIHAGNGYSMDIHEFRLTPGGDALFTVYSPVLVHLAGTPASTSSRLMDAIVQEIDIRTGLVVWEWHCLGHIPLSESYATPANSTSYDAFHLNSVQPLDRGRVLLSARDTSSIYEVDRRSGRILWTLGGKASSFRLGRGVRFYFQHDAGMLPGGEISLFDDEAGPPLEAPSSRGLIVSLDQRRHRASVVRQYRRPANTSAESEGSLQILQGGGAFLGFGSQPYFSEFSASGRLLFDARLPQDDGSYRAYRFPWSATPKTQPAVVARRVDGTHAVLYVSWNGATGVARWQVLAGRAASSLVAVASAPKLGFETRIALAGTARLLAVRALSATGRVLATSAAAPPA
jgi:hypothetical protein